MLAALCTHSGTSGCTRPLVDIPSGKAGVFRPVTPIQGLFNARVKYFGDLISVTCFSKPMFNPMGLEPVKKKDEPPEESVYTYDPETDTISLTLVEGKTVIDPWTGEVVKLSNWREPRQRNDSIKRARDKAFEIAHANAFTHFVTLTLDETKINRYDVSEITRKLSKWLNNQQQRNGLQYLIIPEYHKQKAHETRPAIHFHGLVSGNLRFVDSGHKTEKGQTIYHLENWRYGFTTAVRLDENYSRVVNYVMKYITKDTSRIMGRWYLSGGKGLKRQVPTEYLNLDYQDFGGTEFEIPAAHCAVKYLTIQT